MDLPTKWESRHACFSPVLPSRDGDCYSSSGLASFYPGAAGGRAMKMRFPPSGGGILVPKMESHIAEGLGNSHLSETAARVSFVGFA